MKKQHKKPWSTKDAMDQVYQQNLWGKGKSRFYSGEGSHNLEQIIPYVKKLKSFLTSFEEPISVCDLGCGDFNIGKQLFHFTKKYTAIDIVEDLIEHNTQQFIAKQLEFVCLDIAKDNLPKADCVILRQVLQHLSNKEISIILEKLHRYKYIVLTEHIPAGIFKSNIDIISGQGTRLKKKSGVAILEEPFIFNPKKQTELLSIPNITFGGVVVTWLLEL